MIRLDGIRREIAGLVAERKRLGRRKKPTTAEARQELDRVLEVVVERRVAAAAHGQDLPTWPVSDDEPLVREIDRALGLMGRLCPQGPGKGCEDSEGAHHG